MGGRQSTNEPKSLESLLAHLHKEAKRWEELITNLQLGSMPEMNARIYLYQELDHTHEKIGRTLNNYNRYIGQSDVLHQPPKVPERPKTAAPVRSVPFTKEVEKLKNEIATLKSGFKTKEDACMKAKLELEHLKDQHANSDFIQSTQKENMKTLQAELRLMTNQLKKTEQEKDDLLMRLSKVASDQLTRENSSIADLNDPNRPTKLGEKYTELYDNEWTDAFEALRSDGRQDVDAISVLHLTLIDVMSFCKRKSELQLQLIEEAIDNLFDDRHKTHLVQPQDLICNEWFHTKATGIVKEDDVASIPEQEKQCRKQGITESAKVFRKKAAVSLIEMIHNAYLEFRWTDGQCIAQLKPFIKMCMTICWMMCIQSPPMVLYTPETKNTDRPTGTDASRTKPPEKAVDFDFNMYTPYTKKGPILDYVVWPPLQLEAGGPLVTKGVAQGKNK